MNCFEEKQPKKQTKIENVIKKNKKKGFGERADFPTQRKKDSLLWIVEGEREKVAIYIHTPNTHTIIIIIIIVIQNNSILNTLILYPNK